jgi:hypothetical protein
MPKQSKNTKVPAHPTWSGLNKNLKRKKQAGILDATHSLWEQDPLSYE